MLIIEDTIDVHVSTLVLPVIQNSRVTQYNNVSEKLLLTFFFRVCCL